MINDGLKDAHRQAIIDILSANPRVERAVLFGSRAMGTFTETSDVDIALFGPQLDLDDLAELTDEIDELPMAQRVDLLLYNRIEDDELKEHIKRHGVVWIGASNNKQSTHANCWKRFLLGDACDKISSGATPRGGSEVYLTKGNIALIRSQNVHNDGFKFEGLVYLRDKHARQLANVEVKKDDVLLNITGDSVARACQINQKALPARVNQHVAIVRAESKKLSPRYLRYYLISPAMQSMMLSLASAGGTRNALTKGMIESFEVFAPTDIKEQQAIACILGALDDKIELNRRISQTLEEMARAIFKSWFVDFGPVRAKAEGRDTGLAPEIAALFPDEFEDSELGEIPKGWKVGNLGDIANEFRASIRPDEISSDTPYIALEHMPKRCMALNDWGVADDVTSGKLQFSREDILFGKLRPYFHKVGPAPIDGVCSTDIVVTRPVQNVWFGLVLSHMIADSFVAYTDGSSTGTKMPRTSWRDMAAYPIVIPDRKVAGLHTKTIKTMVKRIHASVFNSCALAALRDALLPKLISGELRVRDAERIVGRCV